MKITLKQLKSLIKEEIDRINENDDAELNDCSMNEDDDNMDDSEPSSSSSTPPSTQSSSMTTQSGGSPSSVRRPVPPPRKRDRNGSEFKMNSILNRSNANDSHKESPNSFSMRSIARKK